MRDLPFLVLFYFLIIRVSAQKIYQKNYFENGNIQSEGWLQNNQKTNYWKFYFNNGILKKEGHYNNNKPIKYWYFYHENGNKKSEGHFLNGNKNSWWLFYNVSGQLIAKAQYENNVKDGYCFRYKNKKIVKAEKYKAGQKIKEWVDYKSFSKENSLRDINANN